MLRRLFNFDEMFDELVWKTYSRWFSKVDGGYELRIAAPGVKKEDIKMWLSDYQLRLETKNGFISLSLPRDVDLNTVESSLDLGVITVSMKEIEKKLIPIK